MSITVDTARNYLVSLFLRFFVCLGLNNGLFRVRLFLVSGLDQSIQQHRSSKQVPTFLEYLAYSVRDIHECVFGEWNIGCHRFCTLLGQIGEANLGNDIPDTNDRAPWYEKTQYFAATGFGMIIAGGTTGRDAVTTTGTGNPDVVEPSSVEFNSLAVPSIWGTFTSWPRHIFVESVRKSTEITEQRAIPCPSLLGSAWKHPPCY
jgi:hypothetical protein